MARVLEHTPACLAGAAEIEEFNWNEQAPHNPGFRRLWAYSGQLARSFVAAAWVRRDPSSPLDRAALGTLAAAATCGALVAATLVAMAVAWVVLGGVEAASRAPDPFGSFAAQANVGVVPSLDAIAETAAGLRSASWRAGRVVAVAGTTLLAVLATTALAIALSAAAVARRGEPVLACLRRLVVLATLVPAVLLSLAFFGRRRSETGATAEETRRGGMDGCAVVGWIVWLPVSLLISLASGSWIAWKMFFISLGVMAALLVGWAVTRRLHSAGGRAWLVGAKVLLDVGLYVGSPAYRRRLQGALSRRIEALRSRHPRHSVVLVGHSLGSVIALDSLANSPCWSRGDDVCLITFGSPITRAFGRFFPGLLFPRRAGDAARAVAGRVRIFEWINVSRRLDYVGGALDFGTPARNARAPQRWRCHTGYWGDPAVWTTVTLGLAASPGPWEPTHAKESAARWVWKSPAIVRGAVTRLRRLGATRWSFLLAAPAFLALGQGTFDMGRWPPPAATGVTVAIPVTHRRELASRMGRYHRFQFDLGEAGVVTIPVANMWGLFTDPRFESNALAEFIREACPPARIWRDPCTRDGIEVTYDPADAQRLSVTDHPARRSGFRSTARWAFALVWLGLGGFISASGAKSLTRLAATLARLLLGDASSRAAARAKAATAPKRPPPP